MFPHAMAKKKTTTRKKKTGTRVTVPKTKFTPAKKRDYIALFQKTGLINATARAIGISPETVRRHRKNDIAFGQQMDDSLRDYIDTIETEAYRRAVKGVLEPVYQGQKLVGHRRIYSDPLLALILKRHVPEYRERFTADVNIAGGIFVAPMSEATSKDWEKAHRKEDDD